MTMTKPMTEQERDQEAELVEVVAYSIFKADQQFAEDQGDTLPDRHFKVAKVLYLWMARSAIEAVRRHVAEQQSTTTPTTEQ
jgi:hypothetical protein